MLQVHVTVMIMHIKVMIMVLIRMRIGFIWQDMTFLVMVEKLHKGHHQATLPN